MGVIRAPPVRKKESIADSPKRAPDSQSVEADEYSSPCRTICPSVVESGDALHGESQVVVQTDHYDHPHASMTPTDLLTDQVRPALIFQDSDFLPRRQGKFSSISAASSVQLLFPAVSSISDINQNTNSATVAVAQVEESYHSDELSNSAWWIILTESTNLDTLDGLWIDSFVVWRTSTLVLHVDCVPTDLFW